MTDRIQPHPLIESVARATALNEYLKVSFGTPVGTDWVIAADVFAPSSARMAALTATTQAQLRTKAANIVGSSLLQGYQWPLLTSTIACYLLDRRVLDLDPNRVMLRYNAEGEVEEITFGCGRFVALADDPAADHEDAQIVADHDALRSAFYTALQRHLGGAIALLCAELKCKPRGLWLNVVDGYAGILAWLIQKQNHAVSPATLQCETDALLQVIGSLFDTRKHVSYYQLAYNERTEIFFNRATCCYQYRTEGGEYCIECPHRTPEDRHQRLLQYMAEQHKTLPTNGTTS